MSIYCAKCSFRMSKLHAIITLTPDLIAEMVPGIGEDFPVQDLTDAAFAGLATSLQMRCPDCGASEWSEVSTRR